MGWKGSFKEGSELVLATSSKDGKPNANIVVSLGFLKDKLLVADCQMFTTIKNLKENKRIAVVGKYYKIRGSVEIFSAGKCFDLCQKKTEDRKVNHAILITIKEIIDLDKCKRIFCN
jgi:hypothetical protein